MSAIAAMPSLPDLVCREILAHCTPDSFVSLRQVSRAWRQASTPHVLQRALSHCGARGPSLPIEDPATLERALRRLTRFERLHERRAQQHRLPIDGLHNFSFTPDATQWLALRDGSHLWCWHLLDDAARRVGEGVNQYLWVDGRADLFAVEEVGTVWWFESHRLHQSDAVDLDIGFPDITMGFAADWSSGVFAAGSWGGVGQMGDLFDDTQRTLLPDAGADTFFYEVALLAGGRAVLHSGAGATLQVTSMGNAAATTPAPPWLRIEMVRQLPDDEAMDAIVYQGGVALFDALSWDLPTTEVLPRSLGLVDMRVLGEGRFWATAASDGTCAVWEVSDAKARMRWRKRLGKGLKRLWLGASPEIFVVQNALDDAHVFAWKGKGCWSLGTCRAPTAGRWQSVDTSLDGRFFLLASQVDWLAPTVVITKRIAPRLSSVPFEDVDAYGYQDY